MWGREVILMRRSIVALSLAASSLALLPAAPAGATHAPCNSSDQLCLRVECVDSAKGSWWLYIDSRGLPHWDLSDCPPSIRL